MREGGRERSVCVRESSPAVPPVTETVTVTLTGLEAVANTQNMASPSPSAALNDDELNPTVTAEKYMTNSEDSMCVCVCVHRVK